MLIDCKGLTCPEPVLRTRDALSTLAEGVIEVMVDNEASCVNVTRFARGQGCQVQMSQQDNVYSLLVSKGAEAKPSPHAPEVEDFDCDLPATVGVVYVISANTMGQGSDELGWGLLQTYVQTIKEISPLPTRILFYNSGVLLTCRQSGILKYLQELEEMGVEILSCGTCIDFFNKNDEVLVGSLTNMFEIMDSMARAQKVLSPH